jgi:DMSO reductase anchor subunit
MSMPTPPARPLALIPEAPQTVWGVPAAINFTLGGLGAGFYVAAALADAAGATASMSLAAWLAPVLVLAGFAAVACEAGRPWRGYRVLRQVRSSWMSRELWLGAAFVAAALADVAAPGRGLRVAAAAAAAALVLAQGAMLMRARAVAAWNVPFMPPVFAAAAAVSGVALLLLSELLAGRTPGPGLLGAALVVIAVALLVWFGYLTAPADPAFARAAAPLTRGAGAIEIVLAGYLAPSILVALALAAPAWAPVPAALAGLLALAGQARARFALVLAAGRRRPVTLATLTLVRRSS